MLWWVKALLLPLEINGKASSQLLQYFGVTGLMNVMGFAVPVIFGVGSL